MSGAAAAAVRDDDDDLFAQIGAFLAAQGLSPDPVNYAFGYDILTRDDVAASVMVARLFDDGVRLSRDEIEMLGSAVVPGQAVAERSAADREWDMAERLVSETRQRAEAIAAVVRAMRDETRGFGRELADQAAAVDATGGGDVARLARAMVARAATAEARLARATDEADALRAELAEAQASARCDPLTGLPNRRALAEAYAALPPEGLHCLALCDVDRFKAVNDCFGHVVGDRVLEAVARLLATGCGDRLVTRQGGEEFAVLFPDTAAAEAMTVLDAARADVAGRRFRDRDTGQPIGTITFSAGLIEVGHDEPIDAALTRVDRLLYAAKANGRNTVVAG